MRKKWSNPENIFYKITSFHLFHFIFALHLNCSPIASKPLEHELHTTEIAFDDCKGLKLGTSQPHSTSLIRFHSWYYYRYQNHVARALLPACWCGMSQIGGISGEQGRGGYSAPPKYSREPRGSSCPLGWKGRQPQECLGLSHRLPERREHRRRLWNSNRK